jgi:hypothetical protein
MPVNELTRLFKNQSQPKRTGWTAGPENVFRLHSQPWRAQASRVRRTALIGFFIGVALGCLFGAMMRVPPSGVDSKRPYGLSVNQQTGKPQLHVKGKPEIK